MNIEETHTFLEYKIKAARENSRLTPQARRADLARAYQTAKIRADELLREVEQQTIRQTRDLKRKAFVPGNGKADPSSAISRRDASDRAAMIEDPAEAVRLLRRAHDHGDDDLAGAIAERAHAQAAIIGRIGGIENPWLKVVAEYVQERPAAREALGELEQVPDLSDASQRLKIGMRYAVQKPSEIQDMSDHQIAILAEADLPDDD